MPIERFPHLEAKRDLREAVQALCGKFSVEYWEECDREHRFPQEFRDEFAAAGFSGVTIPEEYGGGGGTIGDMVAVLEEVAAGGGALNAASTVHIPQLCVPSLLKFGSEEQRKEFLPKIAAGELFVTFGVTEPDAGTDTTKISTRATRQGDNWIVNGTKVWNTGALQGDKIMLLARTSNPETGQRKGEGLTLFLTDLKADTIDIKAIPKIGRNAVASCEVFFRDHEISGADVVGEVGQGFYHLLHSLNGERLYIAAEVLGMGRWAIENAAQYADERVVFGRKIGMNQSVQHPLARGYLNLLAAGLVVNRAVEEYETKGGAAAGTLANASKYLASEAAFQAADDAMQVFGGYSYAREYHIGRFWTETRIQRIAPINNQMILNYISERSLGLPRSY
ncbi:acyl-CoA dehydrogenase family protein [Rhodococcus sp. NPDC057529]|uniref:acyl-CoA dehydrogenase family protein n=1 Tax=Rhodococcus sp. NPDC057529 TaxID=3346158 RepID=UPI00366B7B51